MGLNSYSVYYATCNHCEKEYGSSGETTNQSELIDSLKEDGWLVDVGDDLIVCPSCVKEEIKKASEMLKDEGVK